MSALAAGIARARHALDRVDLRRALVGLATSLGFFGGLAMAVFGVALVSLPAGLIVGGLAAATVAALYARSTS